MRGSTVAVGPAGGVGHRGLEAGDAAGDEGGAEGGALGDGDDVDGQAGAVGQRLHPHVDLGAAAGGDDPCGARGPPRGRGRCGGGRRSRPPRRRPAAGARRRGGARRRAARPAGRAGAAACARPARRAATPGGRRGRPRPGRRAASAPSQRRTRSRNSPPALLGPPISVLPGGRVRDRPEPGHLAPLVDHAPGDERRAAEHEHVAGRRRRRPPAARANASIVPPPDQRAGPGRPSLHRARRLDARHDVGQRRRGGAGRPRRAPRPSRRSRTAGGRSSPWSSRWRPGRTGRGWPPPGPASSRAASGAAAACQARNASSSPLSPGWVGSWPVALAPAVAVEQARARRGARRRRRRRATAPWPTR